ncbi:MAG: wax ester/triacylglycerol synthase family O-acyltransferase [Acidimicrobiales bacterium]
MQQLSGLDTEFLTMEAGHGLGHITGVLIVDPSTSPEPWTFEHYRAHLASRLHLLPVYTKKLREVPFGIDRPYWVPDDDFDLDYHLRFPPCRETVGGKRSPTSSPESTNGHSDRSRPLWESYVIAGVDGDSSACCPRSITAPSMARPAWNARRRARPDSRDSRTTGRRFPSTPAPGVDQPDGGTCRATSSARATACRGPASSWPGPCPRSLRR